MPDIDPNLNIDVSGNTASIATDYLVVNTGASAAHIQLSKMVWGTTAEAFRVSQSTPLPVNIYSTNPSTVLGISGNVTGSVTVSNTGTTGSFVYIRGATGAFLGVTGHIQGITNGVPVGITGTVRITQPIIVGGAGSSGATVYPVEVTGGRRLSSSTDIVGVTGTVTISGGRYLNAVTDTVAVLGSDNGSKVLTRIYDSAGVTLNSTSNALDVFIKNAGFTATVTVGATVGVQNTAATPIFIKGITGATPVVVQGENGGAIEVTATTPLDVSVSNEININDSGIIDALTSTTRPLVSTLTDIKTNTSSITALKTDITSGNLRAKISEITRPARIISGSKSFTSSAAVLESNTALRVGVTLKANSENNSTIYVGSPALLTNNTAGYPLEPGESIYVECANLNAIYAASVSGTQVLNYIGS
jgi:hypothetical protein